MWKSGSKTIHAIPTLSGSRMFLGEAMIKFITYMHTYIHTHAHIYRHIHTQTSHTFRERK